MKLRYITLVLLFFYSAAKAQVDPLYAQYLNNPFLINPAYAGMNKYLNVMAGFRKQWTGFDGSPTTLALTGHTSVADNKMGLGILISQDRIGENTNTLVQAVYAYKINLNQSTLLSFGLQAGMMNYRTDNSELNPYDPTDPLFSGVQNTTKPTFGAGVLVKSDKYFVGLAVPRLLKATTDFESTSGTGEVDLYTQHFYGFASYLFMISDRLRFKPGVLVRAVSGSPLSADINAQLNIEDRYAVGLFTRNFNTYGLLAQIKFNQFRFGYTFELPTNKSVGTNFTTHDLTVGINLGLLRFHDTLELSDF
ncbi:MAG: type IX secretion system membrane protein PorP/SprF [Flammeovirgaceae bacterium]|nr:MAG: type IX secretion system membrane protein PorP/SprF [Flammeovirgaceae bacterium]